MLDELPALRTATEAYRAAAAGAGLAWPDLPAPTRRQPPEVVYRAFEVDHVAEELVWLESQGWDSRRIFPDSAWLQPWPTEADPSLRYLSFAIGTPFPWRHQLPLFICQDVTYTFVLAGEYEGEIWRFESDPDTWGTVRAATSLAALFTEWTRGIEAGVVRDTGDGGGLQVGDGVNDPLDVLLDQAPDLDPFAFPVASIGNEPLLRDRQRECGVDMDCIDRGEDCHEELADAIEAVRTSLRG
ncbi:hypothetical protein GCM10023322_14470 [Rugosimonospora acidiphila]|uniref:SMI1/KNR4 family protein n=1 Tax=Rugosimonospora acidiphila TaxID=556531 RepID=A0ABP9RNB4_9ACTN